MIYTSLHVPAASAVQAAAGTCSCVQVVAAVASVVSIPPYLSEHHNTAHAPNAPIGSDGSGSDGSGSEWIPLDGTPLRSDMRIGVDRGGV